MAEEKDHKAKVDGGSGDEVSVWEAIQTFETILEVFPEDVSALESLAVAYEQAGDTVRARERSLQLARILTRQLDWQKVRDIARNLLSLHPGDEDALVLMRQAEQALGTAPAPAGPAAPPADAQPATPTVGPTVASQTRLSFDLRGELELAWFLLQNGMISQDQYEAAISGLTESRMNPSAEASLSLLQEIRAMDRIDMDKIIDFLSAETTTPFVEISRCNIPDDVSVLIPLEQCRRLGLLPFGRVGKEVMVAVLNPVDKEMRRSLAAWLNTKVHFYLTSPDEFQQAWDAVQKAIQKKKEKTMSGK